MSRDAVKVFELNAVKQLAARVAGTTADRWVLDQLTEVLRNEGKDLGPARWDQLAIIAETVGFTVPDGNSRRAKVSAFRQNLRYAFLFLREEIYLDELDGPPMESSSAVFKHLADGTPKLQKRFKECHAPNQRAFHLSGPLCRRRMVAFSGCMVCVGYS